jgi:hypothetical protein
MSDGISYFETEDTFGSYNAVEWSTPGLTVVIDQLPLMTQVLPPESLPYYNAQVILGKDIGFQVVTTQADGKTAFNLTGVPISFYGKANQSDTTDVFSKSLAGNPADILIPTPSNGIIQVYVRGKDYAGQPVGTTLFLYVDAINAAGNPVNIGMWTLTITY